MAIGPAGRWGVGGPCRPSRCLMSARLFEGEKCDESNSEGRSERARCERGLQAASAQVRRVKFIMRLDVCVGLTQRWAATRYKYNVTVLA